MAADISGLRILLLSNYPAPRGGAEQHVSDLAGILREAGAEVRTLTATDGGRRAPTVFYSFAVRARTRREIRSFEPDLVHVHNFIGRLSFSVFHAAKRAGVPTVLTVHDFHLVCPRTWAIRADGSPCPEAKLPLCLFGACRGEHRGLSGRAVYFLNTFRQRAAARAVRRSAGRIVSPSRALAERVGATTGREVSVVNYPIPAAGDAEFVPPRSDRLLFFGRMSREKGLAELYRALARADVAAAGVDLTLAGTGPEEGALADLASSLGIADRLRPLGWVDSDRIPALIRDHGAVVVPSIWMENSPVSIAEALTAGRPVLAARRGGMPELVTDGETGFLFEPTDPASVASAILAFAGLSPAEKERMARAARESARELFGTGRFLERISAVYASALGRSPQSPATNP